MTQRKKTEKLVLDISEAEETSDQSTAMQTILTEAVVALSEALESIGIPCVLAICARADDAPHGVCYVGSMTTEGVRHICQVVEERRAEYEAGRRDRRDLN